jgi:hypothetical protein
MKIHYSKLKVGQKYWLIDYEKNEVVEASLYQNILDRNSNTIDYDFKHSPVVDSDHPNSPDFQYIYAKVIDGKLVENVGNRVDESYVEAPVFLTKEEAESKKDKYILKSLKAVRKLILKELAENSEAIKKFKGEVNV